MRGFNGKLINSDTISSKYVSTRIQHPDIVQITKEAVLLCDYLWIICHWKQITRSRLTREIQHSLNGMSETIQLLERYPIKEHVEVAVDWLRGYRHAVLKDHFISINDQIHGWNGWRGDLKKYRLSPVNLCSLMEHTSEPVLDFIQKNHKE